MIKKNEQHFYKVEHLCAFNKEAFNTTTCRWELKWSINENLQVGLSWQDMVAYYISTESTNYIAKNIFYLKLT